jgi:hypothetical protein
MAIAQTPDGALVAPDHRSASLPRRLRAALSFRSISALYIFAALFVLFALWIPDTFLARDTWRALLDDQAITALVAVALVIAVAWLIERRSARPPHIRRTADQNVLLITIDTWRADALSAAGGVARTPHLDRLAQSGARFTFAHAHAVITLPSHASILTASRTMFRRSRLA